MADRSDDPVILKAALGWATDHHLATIVVRDQLREALEFVGEILDVDFRTAERVIEDDCAYCQAAIAISVALAGFPDELHGESEADRG